MRGLAQCSNRALNKGDHLFASLDPVHDSLDMSGDAANYKHSQLGPWRIALIHHEDI
jgi:hypothetical protein